MDTALHSVTRRSDATVHVFGSSSPAQATVLRVRAEFRLSETGRKTSLLTGGNGREVQRPRVDVPVTRLHLVHVDSAGVARLRLRPRYEVRQDARIARIDAPPVYDAPPSLEKLFEEAARNHELEAAYLAQRTAAVSARVDAEEARRAQIAQVFLNDSTRRALAHPSPTARECDIATARGRIHFDVKNDRGIARDVPPEAFRRFQADLRLRTDTAVRVRAQEEAIRAERTRRVHDWVAVHGTPDQRSRVAAGMFPIEEGIDAMSKAAFEPVAHLTEYVRDGASHLQSLLLSNPSRSDAVVTPRTLTVRTRELTDATAAQWAVMEEIRTAVPGASVFLRERVLSTTAMADAPSLRMVTVVATKKVGPLTLRREFVVAKTTSTEATETAARIA